MTSMATFQKLAADFPCLIPENVSLSSFSGFVRISGRDFKVRITSDCSRFDADVDLKTVLGAQLPRLEARLRSAGDAHEFLIELRDITERILTSKPDDTRSLQTELPPAAFYELLLNELSQVGWDSVASMEQNMRVLELTAKDSADRTHTISLVLPTDYPQHPPKCGASLPKSFELKWIRSQSLAEVLRQFHSELEVYQDFFRVMEDFDEHTWVLEPEHATWCDVHRRIAVGKHSSARIHIDPRSPIKGFPECRFLGSESAIAPYKQRLNQNMHMWDTSGKTLPRENLERILQESFPSRDDRTDEELSVECGICYAYRLDERVPDIACDLAECSKPYHKECLLEWLRALPDTRESFGTVTGCCVYCEHTISISTKES